MPRPCNECPPVSSDSAVDFSFNGGIVTNPVSINIQDKSAYNLVLWRYHKTPNAVKIHQVYEGVIYEYNTNKILTWTIEDVADVNRNWDRNENPQQQRKFTMCPGGIRWPNERKYHRGCSKYCAELANGAGGFGKKMGDSLTMLATREAGNGGCLFHPGKDDGWSEGCCLCGNKSERGRRNFNVTEYNPDKIKNSKDPAVVWWRNLYDSVVPAICNGKKVHLYTIYKESGISSSGGNTVSDKQSSSNLLNIKTELQKNGFSYGSDFIIRPVYSTSNNFTGKIVEGYRSNQDYLYCANKTMNALKKAIPLFKKKGWVMCIFDAFRPQKAAQAFAKWAKSGGAPSGVIAMNGISRHCYGEAVDLTALDRNGNYIQMVSNIHTSHAQRFGGFDDFDHKNNYSSKSRGHWTKNAEELRSIMKRAGFTNSLDSEYWHFDFGKPSGSVSQETY